MFVNDIVLIEETWEGINTELLLWRDVLDSRGFNICLIKR